MSRVESRRWLLYAPLATAFGLVSLYRLSTAVLSADLARAFDATGAELGTLHAAYFVVYAALQLPAGVVADRLGSRWAVAGGTALMSAGGLAFAAAETYPAAFAARAVIGLGGAFLFVAILRFCANWFRSDEFARMSGLTVAVAGVGGVLATTPLAVTVDRLGWRDTYVGLALFGFVLAVLVALVVRDSPADADFASNGGATAPTTPDIGQVAHNARRVLSERETWLGGIILFAGTGINITVFGLWGVPYVVQTYGLTVTEASTLTLLGSAGLLIGPPGVGYVSDRLERRTGLILVGTVLYTGAFAVLAVVPTPPLVVVGVIFFLAGVLAGAYVLVYSVLKERHAIDASGVATGTVNTLAFAGAAILPAAMGLVLDAYWTGETIAGARVYTPLGYRVAFGLAVLVSLMSLGSAVLLYRRSRDGFERA